MMGMRRGRFVAVAAFLALAVAVGLSGCGGSQDSEAPAQEEAALDFDGSGMEDAGAGRIVLSTPSGTSEGGAVPQLDATDADVVQIGLDYWDGDGTECVVYVDGMENSTMRAGNSQTTISLSGDALAEGTHTVEVVAMDGDSPAVYKSAQYEVVG